MRWTGNNFIGIKVIKKAVTKRDMNIQRQRTASWKAVLPLTKCLRVNLISKFLVPLV